MDRVRLGRALGAGTRQLARTALEVSRAVQAPSSTASPSSAIVPPRTGPPVAARQIAQASVTAGRSSLRAARRAAGVVWLQVMGSFFALIALSTGTMAWRWRAYLRHAPDAAHSAGAWFPLLACGLFSYFSISNFVRAWRRERAALVR